MNSDPSSRAGTWLVLAAVVTLLVLDFAYGLLMGGGQAGGSLTRGWLLGQASVSLTSEPAGAIVYADTTELGTTPLEAAKLLPGRYVLRVEHPHFEPFREPIVLARGDQLRRSLELEPAYGTLELVTNPRGAAIRLNGELLDEVTPATLPHSVAGRYDVELFIEGRKPVRESLDLQRGQTAALNVDLNPLPMAELSLDLQPQDASVEFIGQNLAYAAGMRLPLSTYRVRVSRPGFKPQEQTLALRRGANRFAVELEREFGELRVTVIPESARVTVEAHGETRRYERPVSLATGTVRITASKPGFRSRSNTLRLEPQGAELVLELERYEVTPGRVFTDSLSSCGRGPELVVLAAATFRMGDREGLGAADEQPAHEVALYAPFAIGVREVSRAEWAAQFSPCGKTPQAIGPGSTGPSDPQLPQTDVSYDAIKTYLAWLSAKSGERYRLPSEAEWEYAARAGAAGRYGVADNAGELCAYANVADAALRKVYSAWETLPCNDGQVRLAPTGSFAPNAFGLFDVIGNASEWMADCWHPSYAGAPADGRAWGKRCSAWVARGGSWDTVASNLRVSFRTRVSEEGKELGFRVVREL